jgi:predicted deacetylase
MPTHVSIHDVSPLWAREVDAALALCDRAGARAALLVVPDFHGKAPLLSDPAYVSRLRALQAAGHEVYLHGLRHRSEATPGASRAGRLRWLFAQRVVSNGEAEMIGIPAEEGLRRLDEGERVLREAGLRVDGYVAPAWSMPRWLLPALAARGFRYTEDHLRVYDPAGGRARASVVLNWASRSPARLASTVAWCRAAEVARAVLPARIAIHPGDMRYLALRREVERALRRARGDFVETGRRLLDA